jgi:hypothetical protein
MTNFTDSRFMTAAEKRRVLLQWRRFLKALAQDSPDEGPLYGAFTPALYEHLIQHCSFIAHYNRQGFFEHYFEHGDDTLTFLRQFDRRTNPDGSSTEYGSCCWLHDEYRDINEAMRDVATELAPVITATARARQREYDLAIARHLAAKHGLPFPADDRRSGSLSPTPVLP